MAKFPCGPLPPSVFYQRMQVTPRASVGDKHVTVLPLKFIDIPSKPIQNNPVMKPKFSYALLAALAAVSPALAVNATTTPVGYYNFAGVAGGNIFVPSLVNPSSFSGTLIGAGATTLTLAASSLTANAFNQGVVYATHYVEITSGPQAGAALDIVSNTGSVITLADDITALGLTGAETIKIRPHVTLKSSLAGAEASLTAFADSATFYEADASFVTYYYGGDGGTGWSSDFVNPNGNLKPIRPGTGFVLGLTKPTNTTVSDG